MWEPCVDSGAATVNSLAPMNDPRCFFGAVAAGMKIFSIGGKGESGPLDTVEIYDPIRDCWTAGPSLNTARHSFGSTVVNNLNG